MGTMYWLRVTIMVAILIVVIWTMRKMNTGHETPVSANINLCPTRIAWIETPVDGAHIEEMQSKWLRTITGKTQEIEMISAEKWFSNLCSITTKPTTGGEDFKPVLKLGYVSGPSLEVLMSRTGEFQWDGRTFQSQDLIEALRILPILPEATAPGSH